MTKALRLTIKTFFDLKSYKNCKKSKLTKNDFLTFY
jgi:hypothetical protein